MDDLLTIGGKTYKSRLLVGTGKYKDLEETSFSIEASGAEIVTVAIRRTNIGQDSSKPNILDFLSPDKFTILPNTAGCYSSAGRFPSKPGQILPRFPASGHAKRTSPVRRRRPRREKLE